jgi:hypothetical protein
VVPQPERGGTVLVVERDDAAVLDRAISLAFGVSSTLGTAVAIGRQWRGDTYAFDAELVGELSRTITVMTGPRVDVQRLAATVAACRRLGAFGVCGLARAGFDRGAGSGLVDEHSAMVPLLAVGVRATWEHPVTDRVALELGGEGVVAATSSQFDVDQVAVWHSSRFEALAAAGVLVRFP